MGFFYVPSDHSLDDLVAAAQVEPADDTDAMAEILRRFDGAATSIARSVTPDRELQQDAAQAALLLFY